MFLGQQHKIIEKFCRLQTRSFLFIKTILFQFVKNSILGVTFKNNMFFKTVLSKVRATEHETGNLLQMVASFHEVFTSNLFTLILIYGRGQ